MSTKQANEAQDVIWGLGIGGFVVAVIAGVVALAQWPDSTVDDGNAAVAYLAFAVYTIAQMAIFVALVAVGVRLGVRSLDLSDAIARAVGSRGRPGRRKRIGLRPGLPGRGRTLIGRHLTTECRTFGGRAPRKKIPG